MDKNNLNKFEKELLNELNQRALLIVKIEEVLRECKVPVDKAILYEMDLEQLAHFYEVWSPDGQQKLRNKSVKDETKSSKSNTTND